MILGGLIRDNNSRDTQGLPYLNDFPVLGLRVGTAEISAGRTELLAMITPRVIRNEQNLRDVNLEFRERMRSLRYLPGRVSGDDWGVGGSASFTTGGVPRAPVSGPVAP